MPSRFSINSWLASLLLLLVPAGVRAGALEFVERAGASFASGGEPFPVVGANCYYLMVYSADPGLVAHADEVIDAASELGATVLRTWAFNDGADEWNALQSSPGNYSEKVFRGLDHVIARASQQGLRVLLPLVNNWADYGGMSQYVAWSSTAESHDDFYTDPEIRQWYRDHVRKVLTRVNSVTGIEYRNDPTIFGWELANEPRAEQKGASVLNAWIAEMAAHVKSLDPRHLVSTGSEGFYLAKDAGRNPKPWMASLGVDFLGSHSPNDIDFASFHLYSDFWSLSGEEAVRWARDHARDSARTLGKPLLLGEFGKKQPVSTRDAHFGAEYDELLSNLRPGESSCGSLFWALYHTAYPDYDGFGVYLKKPDHSSTIALIETKFASIKSAVARGGGFLRADATCDGKLDVSDAVTTLRWLFKAGELECCEASMDSNGDGLLDVSDAVFTLLYAFAGGPAPGRFPECERALVCGAAAPACP